MQSINWLPLGESSACKHTQFLGLKEIGKLESASSDYKVI